MNSSVKYKKWIIAISFILTFIIGFYCACHLGMQHSPDEEARYKLCVYLYKHASLPIGDEKEILIDPWGFSYAYRPYLIQILSAFFMRVTSFFSTQDYILLIAARIPSVLSYSLGFVFMYLIGCELFEKEYQRLFLPIIVFAIPQLVFLSGYINNDIVTLAECTAIVFIWIRGYKYKWTRARCLKLGILVGLTMLTYYNAYVYILLSAFVFIWCLLVNENSSITDTLKKAALSVATALLISGWYFIRNYMIYKGDVLGLKAQKLSAQLYATGSQRPELIYNGPNSGLSIWEYFMGHECMGSIGNWFTVSYKSLIAYFGYMMYPLSNHLYLLYSLIFLLGILLFLYFYFCKYKETPGKKFAIITLNILALMLTLILSMYYSWSGDYEPQGRYIITMLIPLGIALSLGYNYIFSSEIFSKRGKSMPLISQNLFLLLYLSLSTYTLYHYMISNCFLSKMYMII